MTGRRIFYLILSALVLAGAIFALFAIAKTESAAACHKRQHRCYAAWPTNTPTRTPTAFQPPLSTPAPPTATNTPTASPVPPTATPEVTLTTVVPPALPSPPAGVYPIRARYVIPRDFAPRYDRVRAITLYKDILESMRLYLAREVGMTVYFDFQVVVSEYTAAQLAAYPYPPTGFNTETFCGVKNPPRFATPQVGTPYCGYTEGVNADGCTPYARQQAEAYPIPEAPYPIEFIGPYPPEIGQGLTETYVWESSAFSTLAKREDGLPLTGNGRLRIDMAMVENAGGWAGGATDILRHPDGSLKSLYGRSLTGDWGIRYYVGLQTLGIPIPPLGWANLLPEDIIAAFDPCAWLMGHDISGRCGSCDADPRYVVFHELYHGLGVDSHAAIGPDGTMIPYNLGSPFVHMADSQKADLLANVGPWLYEVGSWKQGEIAMVSGNPP